MKRKSLFNVHSRTCNCTCKSQYHRTKPNLAVTPGQMFEMAAHGMPISLQNAANFSDGHTGSSWFLPAEKVRGIDPADLWNLQQSSRHKLRKAAADAKAAAKKEREANV